MNQTKKPAAPELVKFKTGGSGDRIEKVKVLRETAACVYLPSISLGKAERREKKQTEWDQYHDTWDAARAYLLSKAEEKVLAARRQLELANAKLGNIKGMKPPKEGK